MNDIVTIVGENTVIKGGLQGDEDLTIYGKVEGTINLSRTLNIESSGIVVADIEVQDAIISGVVVGNITASNSVQITEEGRMVGDLSAPRVIIVDGASYKGHVDMGDLEAPVGERLPSAPDLGVARVSRAAAKPERPAVPVRRPPAAKPAAKKSTPKKAATPKAAPRKAEKPKAPAKPAAKKAPKAAKAAKAPKARRKPPRPPSVPKGKRKVKRRR
jgi:cytoskeletal protein CcmA (bactofilin family)